VATFYTLAQKLGWQPDEQRAITLAICRTINNEPPGDLPQAALQRAKEISNRAKYRGPIAFDGLWYLRGDGVGLAKAIPIAVDDVIYIAAPRHVLAMKENGQQVWRWAAPEAWVRGLWVDRANEKGRGTIYAPAVFASPAGAQVLVVRQPVAAGREFAIRALRASDGKLLWSTDSVAGAEALSFAGNPAVAGRYVYAVAVEFTDQSGSLLLVALDLMDGHIIFKTPLGTMLQMRRAREDPRGWDEFWEQTEPAIAGDLVIATPNVGVAAAVGRFDGKLRWTRGYGENMVIIGRGRERFGGERERLPVPSDSDELLRYRGTPEVIGSTVVIAPQDTPKAFGLDLLSGAELWKLDSSPQTTLIGQNKNLAIFAGDAVEAIEASTGNDKWKYSPPPPARITGPPIVVGGFVYIPITNSKTMIISAENGRVVTGAATSPNFRQLLSSESAKKLLEDALILRTFGPPGVNPGADIGKSE
jgi:outer membrane protein assembly factor BamB